MIMMKFNLSQLRRNFVARVTGLVLLGVVVTSAVVGITTTQATRQFLTGRTSERFPTLLNGASTKIQLWYDRQYRELERLANSQVVREHLGVVAEQGPTEPLNASDGVSQHDLETYLKLVSSRFPAFQTLALYSAEREILATTGPIDAPSARAISDCFNLLGDESGASSAMFDQDVREAHQWLYVPVYNGSQRLATAVARIDVAVLARNFEANNGSYSGEMFLLDSQGLFLTQPPGSGSRVRVGEKGLRVPSHEQRAATPEKRRNYRGQTVFGSMVRVPETDWWLVYEERYDLAMAPVLDAQRRIWVSVLFVAVVFILATFRLLTTMLKPISHLAEGAKRINEGLVGVQIPEAGDDDIGYLINTFNEMAKTIAVSKAELEYRNKTVQSRNEQLAEMNRRLEELSITDGLTGLYNHRHFWSILNSELARVDRYDGHLALVLVDLDDFKRVNDQFGHAAGDELLKAVANVLRDAVREVDVVARYGGEEFAILLPDTDHNGVEAVAEKIRASVERLRVNVPETDITINATVSVGISVFGGNRREFFNDADKALYQSKRDGKNRINFAAAA